jgi:hypothetical protein
MSLPFAAMTISWPVAVIIIWVILMAVVLYGGAKDRHYKLQKAQITAGREESSDATARGSPSATSA